MSCMGVILKKAMKYIFYNKQNIFSHQDINSFDIKHDYLTIFYFYIYCYPGHIH